MGKAWWEMGADGTDIRIVNSQGRGTGDEGTANTNEEWKIKNEIDSPSPSVEEEGEVSFDIQINMR